MKKMHLTESYDELLQQEVSLIESGRCFVAKQVNTAAIQTRWSIGQLLYDRKIESGHGDGVVKRLSDDLSIRYPHMGMSPRQLWNMKNFYLRYSDDNSKLLRLSKGNRAVISCYVSLSLPATAD